MKPSFEPIAIVGQSCVLPGALDPAALWRAVAEGRDLTSNAPEGRWGLDRRLALTDPPGRVADRTWCDRGGYVRGFDKIFDATGFALTADEIDRLDPLFRWVLHTGREALRSASGGDRTTEERAGVVLGNLSFPTLGASRFAESVWLGEDHPLRHEGHDVDPRNHFMSGLPAHLLARALGLGGPAFALDAACASSLVALKTACDTLHDRRADLMLAGAVSCADDLFIHIGFCALDALSPTGRSRPFHAEADGLLPAEGAAFVALRRLNDAVERGDEILGVIRGIGLSNDGRGGGLLAPSEAGQVRAIRRAYEVAGLAPSDISLVECHATGTSLGDATEIRSLGQLYAARDNGSMEKVPIGSLKSNLGHLITTAGLAGLFKVLAAMRAGVRPPTLHTDPPNPVLEGSPFRLLTKAEPWPSNGPRRAALSAFGFGGNNAHLLVEEWRPDAPPPLAAGTTKAADPPAEEPIAIVSLAAMAADAADTDRFARLLFSGESGLQQRHDGTVAGIAEPIELPLVGLGFPPNDLRQTLPQQLALLAAAREATGALASDLPGEHTGVLIGMRCDAEIARYGLRWRLAGWGEGADARWLEGTRDNIVAGLQAAGVVGTMPNMTANRINSMLDLGGPSASISGEEASGLVALDLALRALRRGELDAAIVGAADFSCEPAHEVAVRALIGERIPGDAATVLVLKRLDDARRDGDRVVAVIEGTVESPAEVGHGFHLVHEGENGASDEQRWDLTPRFGHAHAASSLLHVAAAALACHHRALPPTAAAGAPTPWLSRGPRRVEVAFGALESRGAAVRLRDSPESTPAGLPTSPIPSIRLYRGADRAEVLAKLQSGRHETEAGDSTGAARLVLVAGDETQFERRRDAARRLLTGGANGEAQHPGDKTPGVYFRDASLTGELAFVFTGAGAAYHGMGRQLLLAMPQLLDRLAHRMQDMPVAAAWVYRRETEALTPLQQLWGSSFLSQVHSELSRGLLGLEPTAVIGYSSGESNSLMAMGVWNDLDALHRDTIECGLFTDELGGANGTGFAAPSRYWQARGLEAGAWTNLLLKAPVERVEAALAFEKQAYLTLVSSPEDVVIGGEASACQRVVEALGVSAYPLGYDLAVHCPVVEEVAERWLELHRRKTTNVPGVRFYSHSTCSHYQPNQESAAAAILGQAIRTLRFPELVKQAYDDGVRIFLEHGPRGLCSGWIGKILASHGVPENDYLALPLDRAGGASLRQTAETVAQLLAAGVDLRWDLFQSDFDERGKASVKTLSFPAHWPPVDIPTPPTAREEFSRPEIPMKTIAQPQIMAAAPTLPPVLDEVVAATPETPLTMATPAAATAPPAASHLDKDEPPAPAPTEPPATILTAPAVAEPIQGTASAEPAPVASVTSPISAPPTTRPISPVHPDVVARLSELQASVATAQRTFLSSQAQVHHQFLALRQKTLADLLHA
ncbi:MAG: beta-ketoacyl synthase N-terminal-like domain-containing protein, partial [Acidobacteriota bacterium]